jgi:hypothetical protein
MIYLSTTTPTKVTLLSNKDRTAGSSAVDLALNYYTFEIISCDTFDKYVFSPDNWSDSPYYDSFTVSVGTSSISMTGSVMINADAGQYNFTVYKMPTKYNLTIASASYITENGILQITDVNGFNWFAPSQPTAFTQSDSNTITAFTEL